MTALAALISVAASSCSGGSRVLPPTARSATAGSVNMSVVIQVPARPASQRFRRPAYVSPSTASVALTFNGAPVGTINTTAQSPQCASSGASGNLVCSGNFAVSAGTYNYNLTAFDQANGLGVKLSTTSGRFIVVQNEANVLHAILNGIVQSLRVALTPSSVQQGTPTTVQVSVSAVDPDGNVIISNAYVDAAGNPLTVKLASSDTTGALQFSNPTITGVAPNMALNYNGARVPTQTITATAPTVVGGGATLNVATPSVIPIGSVNALALLATPLQPANPAGQWRLTAAVVGIDGSPLPGAAISFTTTGGTLGQASGTSDASGVFTNTITPPTPTGGTPVVAVTASSGTRSSIVNISFGASSLTSRMRRAVGTSASPALAGFTVGPGGSPLSNPFALPDPCHVPDGSTPSGACQQIFSQQRLTFTEIGGAVSAGCVAGQKVMAVVGALSCAGVGITAVACVTAETGVSAVVCGYGLTYISTLTESLRRRGCLRDSAESWS